MVLKGGDFIPKGHLTISGDMFAWVEGAKDGAQGRYAPHPTVQRAAPTAKNDLAQNVHSAKTEKPSFTQNYHVTTWECGGPGNVPR